MFHVRRTSFVQAFPPWLPSAPRVFVLSDTLAFAGFVQKGNSTCWRSVGNDCSGRWESTQGPLKGNHQLDGWEHSIYLSPCISRKEHAKIHGTGRLSQLTCRRHPIPMPAPSHGTKARM